MSVKVKLGNGGKRYEEDPRTRRRSANRPLWQRALLFVVVGGLACLVLGAMVFGYYYNHYQQVVDDRLNNGPLFASTAQVYAAPKEIRTGQTLTAASIAQDLRRAGYNSNPNLGTYRVSGDVITIKPGPGSFHSTDGATIDTTGGSVQNIAAENGAALRAYELEPQVITSLSEDKNRTKRRLVTYSQIPKHMVQAVTAIEDRKFFEHNGLNFGRLIKCGIQDTLTGHFACGGSTLTQQIARGFFLTPEKSIKRKLIEIMITLQLESRFNKQQIFEMYANQINLGQRGSFAVNGFGEASQAYFGKDLKQLDVAECALLAGIVQRPNYFNPFRHPERAIERRNLVIRSMVEEGDISASQGERAQAEPLKLAPQNVDASEAPYFVDMVHDQLQQRIGDQQSSGTLRIYTSLDPDLQKAASDAVAQMMPRIDEMIRKRHKGDAPIKYPQVSLIALDPHTGQVRALVGGRNYGQSQLNHALSSRPTGSIFKPLVFATAFSQSVNGQALGDSGPFTAVTPLNDDPQDFSTGGKSYTPGNFVSGEYPGMVPAQVALEHSLNIATISLAQRVGFENVAAMARAAGIASAKPTPSVAIGTYSATPMDMAGVYTVFANRGVHLNPWLLASVRNDRGDIVADFTPEARQVLDPKVAFLTQSMMEGVMTHGTAQTVRALGFTAPAAGKTGTSHDVWFAGYSSNLLCIVWIGNDDYTDISDNLTRKVQGADTAAPIWAEFMNRAIKLPQYSDMKPFTPVPDGISLYKIDKATSQLADETCPGGSFTAAFLEGTQPHNTCSHMGDGTGIMGSLFGADSSTAGTNMTGGGSGNNGINNGNGSNGYNSAPTNTNPDGTPHRNIFQKMFGLGKRDENNTQPTPTQPATPQSPPPQQIVIPR
ncbi:membrane carboxypeptidase (penicillin-binding protein) [Terriglobus roseus DSM 18391]|uniref:Membrane carboxypeptidase (Penicillin-binding protein) n=1 Tax=Terriglobus roseus (strain DSM 18391 / NRRL B-41598 / KBS 63) TaxID=926566 RepID=I3ZCW2_TERRK|nr:transglycosylase domain-containing protein [Terriglobus roseus]AFL87080.1 membrane carboxypeptidase (penicillin-binding protein) [Terriglobus roseus DSM 18391]